MVGSAGGFTANRSHEPMTPASFCAGGIPIQDQTSAFRLRIYIGERDHFGHQPLFTALVEAGRRAKLAGATVFKGIEGFGARSIVHAARVIDLSNDLPIILEFVDSQDKLTAFLDTVRDMLADGMATMEPVTIVYRSEGQSGA